MLYKTKITAWRAYYDSEELFYTQPKEIQSKLYVLCKAVSVCYPSLITDARRPEEGHWAIRTLDENLSCV